MKVGGGGEEGVCAKDVCWEVAQLRGELEACDAHFLGGGVIRDGGREIGWCGDKKLNSVNINTHTIWFYFQFFRPCDLWSLRL